MTCRSGPNRFTLTLDTGAGTTNLGPSVVKKLRLAPAGAPGAAYAGLDCPVVVNHYTMGPAGSAYGRRGLRSGRNIAREPAVGAPTDRWSVRVMGQAAPSFHPVSPAAALKFSRHGGHGCSRVIALRAFQVQREDAAAGVGWRRLVPFVG